MRTTLLTLLLLIPGLLLFVGTASAEEELNVSYRTTTQTMKGQDAEFRILATIPTKVVEVKLKRLKPKGKERKFSDKGAPPNTETVFKWTEKKAGRYDYQADFRVVSRSGIEVKGSYTFAVDFQTSLVLSVPKSEVSLAEGHLLFSANRPVAEATVKVFTEGGALIAENLIEYGGKKNNLKMTWKATADPVTKIDLKVTDTQGVWAGYLLVPFTVEIPHEDVTFAEDAHKIAASERPKLDAALQKILEEMGKHGADFEFNLYVVGYTDTVGSNKSNQELSGRRAKSIARYFKKNGVTIPIFYQGMGEEGLAVGTPDNTDEPRNRRATYLLSNAHPTGGGMPRGWRKL